MEGLFAKWRSRASIPSSVDTATTSNPSNDVLDKNSKMLLNSVVYANRKHKKQNIPLDYTFDEESKSFEQVDVVGQITPFTTDKTGLYESLEHDLIAFKNSSKLKE
jgi:hypothetical protein